MIPILMQSPALRGSGGGPDAAHTILTVTDGGGFALYTTADPHGLDGSAIIAVTGVSVIDYNVTEFPIILSVTTFSFGLEYVSDGTGGQWELA